MPRLRRVLVAPGTTTIRGLTSEVVLESGVDPVPRVSAVCLDRVESVSIGVLIEHLGRLGDDHKREVCSACEIAQGSGGRRCLIPPVNL